MVGNLVAGVALGGKLAIGAALGVSACAGVGATETHHTNSTTVISQHQVKFTEDKARVIALKGCSGTFKSVSFQNNVYTYIIHKDSTDYKVTVNGETGEVLKVEALSYIQVLPQDDAKEIALKACPGTYKSVSFESNVYVFVIHTDSVDHIVKVNAKTGTCSCN